MIMVAMVDLERTLDIFGVLARHPDRNALMDVYLHLYDKLPRPLVDAHVELLGEPDARWRLGSEECEFACWALGSDAAVLVNDGKGVYIEMDQDAAPKRAESALFEYLRKIGVEDADVSP